MKVVAVFVAVLAASLAAPRDLSPNVEKVVTPVEAVDSEKLVSNVKVIELSTTDSLSEEKVVVERGDKIEEKVEDKVEKEAIEKEEEKIAEGKIDEEIEAEIVAPEEETVADDSVEKKNPNGEAAAALEAAEEKEKDLSEYSAVCRASTGATIEQISTISEDPVEDAPRAVKCYIKCIAEHLGIVKEQVLQKDVAAATKPSALSTDELDLAVDTCSNLKTDDPCDSSYLRYSCYFRTTGKKVRIF